jgi:hypothetical protein
MIRSLVDQDNVVPLTDFAAQVSRRDDSAAAAPQYYDLLSLVASSHASASLFTQFFFVSKRWRERIASPFRLLSLRSRQSRCSIRPSSVSSFPNPEVTPRNQRIILSEKSLIHSFMVFAQWRRDRGTLQCQAMPLDPTLSKKGIFLAELFACVQQTLGSWS